jgi:3-phosphoshikimate 1-carboxyvinyltransferase
VPPSAPPHRTVVSVTPGPAVNGTIRPPGSKSLTNRAVLLAALAPGRSLLRGALVSEDTHVCIDALKRCGARIESSDDGQTLQIDGIGDTPAPLSAQPLDLFVANSGTSMRFLAAALSARGGSYQLRGVERMHQRPIDDLINAIIALGGDANALSPGGCPPVRLEGNGWHGGHASILGNKSSQFLSGLMMAAPLAKHPVRLTVDGDLVSQPYVAMTVSVMDAFGVRIDQPVVGTYQIEAPQRYHSIQYDIEPDASAASYFWAAAAISGGQVTVQGLTRDALQGDVAFCNCLESMGCHVQELDNAITLRGPSLDGRPLQGIDVGMNAISDTVQTLAVVALFAEGPTVIRGVAHNRFKETDRIGDLARELRKLGATIDELDDGLRIVPPPRVKPARLATYNDHRMAMSLALVGLRAANIWIENPSCTAKTYPNYFADLERLIGRPHRWVDSGSSSHPAADTSGA